MLFTAPGKLQRETLRGVGGQREKGVQIEDSEHGTEKDENDIDTPPLLLLGFLFLKV
jgi:hypothetical protein